MKRIIDMMPLPDAAIRMTTAATGTHRSVNDAWYTVGVALMDDGTLEPIVWDGWYRFRNGNPLQQDR